MDRESFDQETVTSSSWISSVESRFSARRTPWVTTMTSETPREAEADTWTHGTKNPTSTNMYELRYRRTTHRRTTHAQTNTHPHTYTHIHIHTHTHPHTCTHAHTHVPINQKTVLPTAPKYNIGITKINKTAYISFGLNSLPANLTFCPLFLTETNHHTTAHTASAMSNVGFVILCVCVHGEGGGRSWVVNWHPIRIYVH